LLFKRTAVTPDCFPKSENQGVAFPNKEILNSNGAEGPGEKEKT
jgi:hypothetical protein